MWRSLVLAGCLVLASLSGAAAESGFMGLNISPLNMIMMNKLGLKPGVQGTVVRDVIPDGPAAKAGFQKHDLIVEFDGAVVRGYSQMKILASGMKPGQSAAFTILRDGQRMPLTLIVGGDRERNEARQRVLNLESYGFTLQIASDKHRKKYDIAAGADGMVVLEVTPGGKAATAQLTPGDLILTLNRRPVPDAIEFDRTLTEEADGPHPNLTFHALRGTKKVVLVVPK